MTMTTCKKGEGGGGGKGGNKIVLNLDNGNDSWNWGIVREKGRKLMERITPSEGLTSSAKKTGTVEWVTIESPDREAEMMKIQFRVVSCERTLFCSLSERFGDDTVIQHEAKLGKPCLFSLLARRPMDGTSVVVLALCRRRCTYVGLWNSGELGL